jgi:5-(carboxyamino)imidazole ribonucleotide synthase
MPTAPNWVVEKWVSFQAEASAIVARDAAGRTSVFPVAENEHRHHILDATIVPARLPPETVRAAEDLARNIAERIGLVGLLAVELFVLQDGTLLVNELAPRPHNSGHYTLEGCLVSQFEQHVRAVCGLPLGETSLRCPAAVMLNLLGEVWAHGEPDWSVVLAEPTATLHLYGKRDPRPGRKMGHLTLVGASQAETLAKALHLRRRLSRGKV